MEDAKSYMVNYHFLNQENPLYGYESIHTIFDRLKSIQYDPLNVVGNNSELVMQSRIEDYSLGDIQKALYDDRFLVDGWDKQMGIYQTKYFPHFERVRENRSRGSIRTLEYRLQFDALDYVDDIIDIIRNDGPKFSKDIKFGETQKHRWGSSKPSSGTLDYLFHKGIIGIKERKNTQKKYDLIENLIGNVANVTIDNTDDEFIKWFLFRRIKTMGLVWNKSSVCWSGLHINKKQLRTKYLDILVKEGLIQKVSVEGVNEGFYAPYESLLNPIKISNKVSFIAPLDNFMWDRDMIETLFDFIYRWEVYTPIIKRKYGYYVLPVLYNNYFIGRIEFEQQRRDEPLVVKDFWWESNVLVNSEIKEAMSLSLQKMKNYLGASDVINIEKIYK